MTQLHTLPAAILVDMGTTNTRTWLMSGRSIVAVARAAAGVRDTARSGTADAITAALHTLCANLLLRGAEVGVTPAFVAGAGMIGSPLGLAEVPHLVAPAGVDELAFGIHRFELRAITSLPVFIVPGIRTPHADGGSGLDGDVMRGEETLCLGLVRQGLITRTGLVLNLGSHWKLIQIGEDGRIAWSETTLGGELAHAVWHETILAAALPDPPELRFDEPWVAAGRHAARDLGFARALFGVRLLHATGNSTADDRLGFLYGALIESHLQPWLQRKRIRLGDTVTIVGPPALAEAWRAALAEHGVEAGIITVDRAEHCFVTGLAEILARTSLLRGSA